MCKTKQKSSCFRTAEEEVENKACKPLLKLFHLPGMFHLCRYLCKLYSSINTPGFPWCFLPLINYPVQIQFVPALCSEFCTLLYHSYFVSFQFWDADTLKAWTIKFNCVTETEHISDKCLLSKWRLLDDLRVCNGPLKNTSVLPGWEKWEKHSKQSYTWRKTTFAHVASNVSPDKTHLWKFKFDL